ncbi:hypothetical protein EW146_g355 [Bondarzewia mesenterica]|uniref:PX domain-containing protein n=1 Tax=Bondarzewia mesenterica TaxID=1095465 RepID=A0A4S4M7L6_9AGAM|nr:hypothetical protein EW146_g355 [Bondarzewia mesenterica]
MTTLPRVKSPLTPTGLSSLFFSFTRSQDDQQPGSRVKSAIEIHPSFDFDAGINTSAAWTEHLDSDGQGPNSLSDDEPEDAFEDEIDGRAARVLYKFEGKPEFRELSVAGGEQVEIIREQVGDGWSLAKNESGEIGLLPQSYYTFTVDFISSPEESSHARISTRTQRQGLSTTSLTPRASPTRSPITLAPAGPIIVQTTGERMMAAFPSFRQSLLGGKNLNRFSSFVTSGAEAYVLRGEGATGEADATFPPSTHNLEYSEDEDEDDERDGSDTDGTGKVRFSEADRHFVDAGPSWKSKVPPFRVLVHSPSKRTSTLSGAYTIYSVTSLFHLPQSDLDPDSPPQSPARITVHRRFSHFVVLHTALTRRLPGIALPPLPEKQYAGRFNDDFVEARRGDLERYLEKVVRHPVARYAEVLTFFLGCESETEWKRQLPRHLALPPAGPIFFANVFHPAYNLDADEAVEVVDKFETHTMAVGAGVQDMRSIFGQIRQARVEMSKAEHLLSYSLLSLITSKRLAPASSPEYDDDAYESDRDSEIEDKRQDGKKKGLLNEEGAWCWREGCEDCLKLTKALQKTAETLQSVGDLYDDHARRTQLATHEALKGVAHPSQLYAPVVDTHRNALSRFTEATRNDGTDEEVAARCETVLNTTMAEMETYHTQKVEDFSSLAKEHLDGEIAFYEQARSSMSPPSPHCSQ